LIEGEQIINFDNKSNEIIYEGQESYMINSTGVKTTIAYPKEKRQKEIKIRIDHNFIKKHHIDEAYTILENHLPFKLKNDLSKPLCVRTQEIISEIATDKRSGLLKRLFLESKTLELIALQLDLKSNIESNIEQKSDSLVKKLYKVQHIINSDLTSQYVIQQLAREVGLNDFVLKKEFKRVFNQTVFEYASHVRMSKAKQLLLHTDKPIYEISEIVGYKNATHFSAAFKKTEKITPKKYRGLLL
jgi:AraC-like DNA-binding protein